MSSARWGQEGRRLEERGSIGILSHAHSVETPEGSSGSQEGRDAKKRGDRSKQGNGRDTLSAHSSIRAVAGASTPAGCARMRMRQMKWRGTRGFIIAASQSFKGVDEKDDCTLAQDVPVCQ